MNIVETLDSVILKFFTKISHRIQIVTGKTNFFLAKIALCVMIIDLMIVILNYWLSLLEKQTDLVVFVFETFALLMYILITMICDQAEQSAQLDNPTKFPFEPTPILRLIILFSACILIIPMDIKNVTTLQGAFIFKFYRLLADIAFVAYIYLISVHPLPPGKSKIRELIESFAAGFAKQAPSR